MFSGGDQTRGMFMLSTLKTGFPQRQENLENKNGKFKENVLFVKKSWHFVIRFGTFLILPLDFVRLKLKLVFVVCTLRYV